MFVLNIMAIWTIVSIPVALFLGRFIAFSDECCDEAVAN